MTGKSFFYVDGGALADMAKAFSLTLHSEVYKKIQKVEALKERLGRTPKAREIYRNFRDINVNEAEYIIEIVNENKVIGRSHTQVLIPKGRPKCD